MIELLTSKKFKLPTLYFVSDRKEIKDIPIGIPYIVGNEKDKHYFIKLLEYQVLYQKCLESKLPFKWEKILKDNGYNPVHAPDGHPVYFDFDVSEEGWEDIDGELYSINDITETNGDFKNYIEDCKAIINVDKLKELNVFPVWLDTIEKSIETNIHNFALYNPYLYNKKLEGMYGNMDITSPSRNLVICDISGSMTKAIATFILLYSKTMAETFYADILITGGKSILFHYEELYLLDVDGVYDTVGRSNEGDMFKKLLSEPRKYKSAIVFGDNDHPGSYGSEAISDADGKTLCKWEIDKLISFHKDSNTQLAGYSRWFSPKETECIKDWVTYLA